MGHGPPRVPTRHHRPPRGHEGLSQLQHPRLQDRSPRGSPQALTAYQAIQAAARDPGAPSGRRERLGAVLTVRPGWRECQAVHPTFLGPLEAGPGAQQGAGGVLSRGQGRNTRSPRGCRGRTPVLVSKATATGLGGSQGNRLQGLGAPDRAGQSSLGRSFLSLFRFGVQP